MSSRSSNNVRGPTSALTEFLRESGINPASIARRAAQVNQAAAGPSNAAQNDEQVEQETPAEASAQATPSRSRRTRLSGYVSDELDDREEEKPTAKKRKMSKAAEAKAKAAAKAKAKKAGKYDDSDDDDSDDEYNALSKSVWTNDKSSKPAVGDFSDCAKCEKQFTVTKYTVAAVPGPGFLCHPCAKASGTDPFKKPALRKRKPAAEKREIVNFQEKRFPTLASMCIQIITQYINDVEALGDIGALNMDEIAKSLAKNRSLTPENVFLFYDIKNTKLALYDATKLTPPSLGALAPLNPNLTHLQLEFCGRLDCEVINAWCTSLPCLLRLELLGPFLVRAEAWKAFFKSHPQLEGFLITQSPRFDLECLQLLVDNCKDLHELRLKEVGKLDDSFVEPLALAGNLTSLDLSDPGTSISVEGMVGLMGIIGQRLTHLDMSGHTLLDDTFLTDGIIQHTRVLTSLSLANLPELTDEGVAGFFSAWADTAFPNPPLTALDLSRNHELSSLALAAILQHSGHTLTQLNINGWRSTSEETLDQLGKVMAELRFLDVGWCSEVSDFVLKSLMDGCNHLKEVRCWGCNRLSESCPRKRTVNMYGVQAHSL